jgi:hypothetical protein
MPALAEGANGGLQVLLLPTSVRKSLSLLSFFTPLSSVVQYHNVVCRRHRLSESHRIGSPQRYRYRVH